MTDGELLGLPFFRREAGMIMRQMNPKDRPCALFDGRVPTRSELRLLVDRGYGLRLIAVPRDHADLRFLEGVELIQLEIVGADLDTRVVSRMVSLIRLELSLVDDSVTDLSGLPRLQRFSGFLSGCESVFRAPALEVAALQEVWQGALPAIPETIVELSLMDARNVRSLSSDGPNPALERLVIGSARVFDVGSLAPFSRLHLLHLDHVRKVEGIAAVNSLPIRQLGFVSCREIVDADSLRELTGAVVGVSGKLSASLRDIAEDSPSEWHFYRS